MKSKPRQQRRYRRGMSLLEVTIGSLMAGTVVMMAAGVTMDLTRHMASHIVETQVRGEARLAIESLRRDFSGSLPDQRTGERGQWRLVGRMVPSVDELRLCFDAQQDASADWIAPDRVITYILDDQRLIRIDALTGNEYTVARYVDDVQFVIAGGEIQITIEFGLGDFTETYSFVTADF